MSLFGTSVLGSDQETTPVFDKVTTISCEAGQTYDLTLSKCLDTPSKVGTDMPTTLPRTGQTEAVTVVDPLISFRESTPWLLGAAALGVVAVLVCTK